jgi:thioredoxin-related protein
MPRIAMFSFALALVGGAIFYPGASAQAEDKSEAKWHENYEAAQKLAKKEGKLLLVDFTGSGWCIKLKKEVFNTPEFKKWAAKHVVLVELDFPRRKAQSADIKKQNNALRTKYKIRGYPTILFLKHDGTKVGKSGYKPGGPPAWIAHAQRIVDANKSS